MTLHHNVTMDEATGVGIATSPDGLSAIDDPGCGAAIWHRRPAQCFQDWIDRLAPDQLPRARLMLRPEVVRSAMTYIADSAGLPQSDERTMLVDDVAALCTIFASVMAAPYLRLRLDVVETNACRKFHIDAVTARLICTYRGSGTQYGIGQRGEEPESICSVPTGSPMIMRGTCWPNGATSNLLHRSPPIEGTGETRLVLVLDPLADLEAGTSEQFFH